MGACQVGYVHCYYCGEYWRVVLQDEEDGEHLECPDCHHRAGLFESAEGEEA